MLNLFKKKKPEIDLSNPENSMMEKLAFQNLVEMRKQRRWGTFVKVLFLVYLIACLVLVFKDSGSGRDVTTKPHAAVVNINGVIADDADVNTKNITASLKEAFKDEHAEAVILNINSPGGSPVISDNIYQEIRYLESENPDKKVYAICGDVCASGGYFIASAADKIYANKMSLVGSIGVRAGGFGFVDGMKKVGVTRRLYTAGANKGFLDPYSPQSDEQVAEINKILSQTHTVFIDAVKQGRGDRINEKYSKEIFSGAPFDGVEAKQYGLIDDYGSMNSVLRTLKLEDTVNYTHKKSLLDKFTSRLGVELSTKLESFLNLKLS